MTRCVSCDQELTESDVTYNADSRFCDRCQITHDQWLSFIEAWKSIHEWGKG